MLRVQLRLTLTTNTLNARAVLYTRLCVGALISSSPSSKS